jgi:type VI secretion system FHA domain protein
VLKIAVVAVRGGAGGAGLFALFDATGGSIGRAKTNQLVLEDPDRTVSRVHAQVLCRDQQYFVVDRGSNPLLHNGTALGSGNEAPLAAGDRLQIGGFDLVVSLSGASPVAGAAGHLPDDGTLMGTQGAKVAAAAQAADDPFADLLAGLTPAPSAAPVVSAAASKAAPAPNFFPDPMGMDAPAARPVSHDPFADLLNFGNTGAMKAAPGGGLGLDNVPNANTASIDELFGLGAGVSGAADPLASSPLSQPTHLPNTAGSLDPLMALQSDREVVQKARSDHVGALHQAYAIPRAVQPPPPAPMPAPSPAASQPDSLPEMTLMPPVASPKPPPAVTPALVPSPVPVPVAPVKAAAPAPAMPAPYVSAPVAPPAQQMPAAPAPVAVAPRAASSSAVPAMPSASEQELLAAFLRGARTTNNMPTQLTPALMELIGALLFSATHGTLQLLMSRQELKQGFNSEMTMISREANNPLKFSPNPEIALAHLLGPPLRGFMPPEQAMVNAFEDLRAHQFGVMVGMRAALANVLEQFSPDKLEGKLAQKSKLDALFAAGRKAKLWDVFCQLYGNIAAEAEDDFHTLYGKSFTKAYEEQMARFKAENS